MAKLTNIGKFVKHQVLNFGLYIPDHLLCKTGSHKLLGCLTLEVWGSYKKVPEPYRYSAVLTGDVPASWLVDINLDDSV